MTPEKAMQLMNCKNQSELSRKMGVTRQAISYWFKTNRVPELWQYKIRDMVKPS